MQAVKTRSYTQLPLKQQGMIQPSDTSSQTGVSVNAETDAWTAQQVAASLEEALLPLHPSQNFTYQW